MNFWFSQQSGLISKACKTLHFTGGARQTWGSGPVCKPEWNWTRRKGMGSSRSADDDLGSGMTKSGVMMGGTRWIFFFCSHSPLGNFSVDKSQLILNKWETTEQKNWKQIRHCYLGNKWEISFPKNESQSIFHFAVSGFFLSMHPKPWISFRHPKPWISFRHW